MMKIMGKRKHSPPTHNLVLVLMKHYESSETQLFNIIKISINTEELVYKAFSVHYITYLNIKLFNDHTKINLEKNYLLWHDKRELSISFVFHPINHNYGKLRQTTKTYHQCITSFQYKTSSLERVVVLSPGFAWKSLGKIFKRLDVYISP